MVAHIVDVIVGLLDWVIWLCLWLREGLCPSPAPVQVHQGGIAILPELETMKVQPELVKVLGEKKAIILQKFHEWVQVNEAKGSHSYQGATWTYGSYDDWNERHFAWFTPGWFGTLIRQLEADGYLYSTMEAKFCFKGQKAYRLNYEKIRSAVGCEKVYAGVIESVTPRETKYTEGFDKVAPNNSNKTNQNKKTVKQDKQTPSETRARDGSAPVIDDGGVEKPASDSGVFVGLGEAVSSTVDSPEETAVVTQLMDDMPGLTEKTARAMVDAHGKERCTAVGNWVYRHGKENGIRNPAGFWVDELRSDRLGIGSEYARSEWEQEQSLFRTGTQVEEIASPVIEASQHDDAWEQVMERMQGVWDSANFETWLKSAQFVEKDGNGYVVSVPNVYVCDMLQYRMYDDVQRVLSDVVGEDTPITFVVRRELAIA